MAEIDGYRITITSDEVYDRITDLEESRKYDVVRLRNGAILATYDDEDDAQRYIDDEDYDPGRVTVRRRELDDDDQLELDGLRRLQEAVGDGNWTICSSEYFDEQWAREQAVMYSGFSPSQLDDWPLSLVNWDDAAAQQRDNLYPYDYEFDGTTFYGNG